MPRYVSPRALKALVVVSLVASPLPAGCGDSGGESVGSDGSTGAGTSADTSADTSTSASATAATSTSGSSTGGSDGETGTSSSTGTSGSTATTGEATSTDGGSGGSSGGDDPCEPNPCVEPPAPSCEGDIAIGWLPEGTCELVDARPQCSWDEDSTDCGAQGQLCEAGACVPIPPPGAGALVFVELQPDPVTLSDADAEWFELKNVTDAPVDLEGCVLSDLGVNDDAHTIESGGPLVVEAGALVVLAKTDAVELNGGIEGVVYSFGELFSLTNTGDDVILSCDDVEVDSLSYTPQEWPYDVGVAMRLDPAKQSADANDDPASWCAAVSEYHPGNLGTPGVANQPCG